MFKYCFILLTFFQSYSWSQDMVNWTASKENSGSITLKAQVKEGWHLYSQFTDPSSGPVPTQFMVHYNQEPKVVAVQVEEPKPKIVFDPNFEAEVKYFESNVDFILPKDRLLNATIKHVSVVFMVCNDTMCLPPEEVQIKL